MKRALKIAAWIAGGGVGVALLSLLGGSMIWVAGGTKRLEIKGDAKPVREAPPSGGWAHYGGDAGGMRFSSANDITRENVSKLMVAWRYSTGDLTAKPEAMRRSAGETTPMTYVWQGKQNVAIFAGGYANVDAKPGDELVAFALPD